MNSYKWWQTGIIYEIYLRSFQDTNGDGVGDLRGVIQRLDYLQWLGVNILWITPFYPSPMKDFGYDISDYTGVDSLFGTMDDFDKLVSEVHKRDMKIVIDFVPNHTSDKHPWFIQSRSSKENSKRDWYIWKDKSQNAEYPNNWLSVLGGSAWEWDKHTGQYYYHAFLKEQPDLNLRNTELRSALINILRFWLDKGVDGFRVDVMWHLAKDKLFRDNPVNPDYTNDMPDCDRLLQIYNCDQPEALDYIAEWRTLMDEYEDKLLMGEIYLPLFKTAAYYGNKNNAAHLPSNFQLLFVPWEAKSIAATVNEYECVLPESAWPNWVLGNHDRPRLINRIGKEQTCNAAILLLTLRGTPIMYYGDEIGIPKVMIPEEEVRDPQGLQMPGKNLSRDPQRTPMQWNSSANAGFTYGKPWLRLSESYESENVNVEKNDSDSLLWLYKRLIDLRQREASLVTGDYRPVYVDECIFSYVRDASGHDSFLIILNFGKEDKTCDHFLLSFHGHVVIHSDTGLEGTEVAGSFVLPASSGCVIRLRR